MVLALIIWVLPTLATRAARSSERSDTCDVVAGLTCGGGVRLIAEGRALPFRYTKKLSATNRDKWESMWEYLGLPPPVPSVDFTAEIVVAWVGRGTSCEEGGPTVLVCRSGELRLKRRIGPCTHYSGEEPQPRFWILAVARSMLANPSKASTGANAKGQNCTPEIDAAEIARRWQAQRSRRGERTWIQQLRWDTAAGLVGGVSPTQGGLWGTELRFGLRDDIGFRWNDGFFGDLIGVDLRSRWLMAPNAERAGTFMLGLWPWMMMSYDWLFNRPFSRQPTFMNVLVPEAGVVLDGGVGGYLYWSFPLMLREEIHFYRTTPYVVGEHSAYELAPGLLWLLSPSGRNLAFTLSLSAGLW
jgi:hypothetical protein